MLRAAHSEESIPLRKGTWTAEEDQRLTSFIQTNGVWNWNSLPKAAGLLRSGKSCRLRWVNYLRPDIKHGNFSAEEVETILKLHQDMGNRWSQIALRLPGRTDNEIKNFWNSHLKKRQKKRPRNNAVQATEAQKQENISEEYASSLNAPKAPYLEGLEETPTSPEPCAPVKFSSASSSFAKLEETHTIKEKIAFQEFPGDLQGLRNGAILGNGTSRSDLGYVASSSSALFSGINKDQAAEKNNNSPGLSEELKSIWEQPFFADDFQEKVLFDGSMYPCTLNATDDFWVYPFM